jgi:GNAT superfamily N-acetyltransferase
MVDAGDRVGQLRWFLLTPEARGTGLGRRLLETALGYGRERGFSHVFLWTFADLAAALRLYERTGFKLTEKKTGIVWGAERTEVRMDMELGST